MNIKEEIKKIEENKKKELEATYIDIKSKRDEMKNKAKVFNSQKPGNNNVNSLKYIDSQLEAIKRESSSFYDEALNKQIEIQKKYNKQIEDLIENNKMKELDPSEIDTSKYQLMKDMILVEKDIEKIRDMKRSYVNSADFEKITMLNICIKLRIEQEKEQYIRDSLKSILNENSIGYSTYVNEDSLKMGVGIMTSKDSFINAIVANNPYFNLED